MVQEPKIRRIEVILRDSAPTASCRASDKHDGVNLCFDSRSNVTKYSYEPSTFSGAFGTDLQKLDSIIGECKLCNRSSTLVAQLSKEPELSYSDKAYKFAMDYLSHLSEKHEVPVPTTELGECPIGTTKTCYAFRNVSPEDGTIYLHPEDLGPTAIAHEFFHYMATYKHGKHVGGDELAAIAFAKKEVNEAFPTEDYTELGYDFVPSKRSHGFQNDEESLNTHTTMNLQVSGTMFEKLNRLYNLPAKIFKMPAGELNEAWTPELIGTAIEVGTKTGLTTFGATLVNLLGGLALIGVATTKGVKGKDKKFLHEIAAHMITRLATLGNPSEFGVALSQAKDFGRSFGMADFGGVASTITKSFDAVAADVNSAMGSFGRSFGGFTPTVASVPAPPTAPSASQVSRLFDIDLGISQA